MSVIFAGLLLFSCSVSASFIEHSAPAEPAVLLPILPQQVGGGHAHTHHHSHRSLPKHRVHQRTLHVGRLLEVPYTLAAGSFVDLKRRAPAKGDTKDSGGTTDSNDVPEGCENIHCEKGSYCSGPGEFSRSAWEMDGWRI